MAETNAETDGSEHARLAGELADARRRIAELEALVAERSHAQEELRQDQRLYRELFEDSLGLMCVHDLDGVLLIVNPAAAQSLGFRPEEGVGVNMKRFLAPPVRHFFDAYLERIRRNRSDSGLMRLVARDGNERIWLYRNALYEEPGTPPRVLGHAQDITDRVRADEALKESERRGAVRICEQSLVGFFGPDIRTGNRQRLDGRLASRRSGTRLGGFREGHRLA
jgi:PAS domain S-box-containing protein